VRLVFIRGEPWWVLADVCAVLEIGNPRDVARRLDDDEKGTVDSIDGGQGGPPRTIISEPGLYAVLRSSRKPQAKRFDRWVRHEVLPQIRKTGSFQGKAPTLNEIGILMRTELEPVHKGMAQMRGEIAEVKDNVYFLRERVDAIAPRNDFSKN